MAYLWTQVFSLTVFLRFILVGKCCCSLYLLTGYNILLYEYTTVDQSTLMLMGIWTVFRFLLLWTMLLGPYVCVSPRIHV